MKIQFSVGKTWIVAGQVRSFRAGQVVSCPVELPLWAADMFMRMNAAKRIDTEKPRQQVLNRDLGPAPESRVEEPSEPVDLYGQLEEPGEYPVENEPEPVMCAATCAAAVICAATCAAAVICAATCAAEIGGPA